MCACAFIVYATCVGGPSQTKRRFWISWSCVIAAYELPSVDTGY